LQDLFTGKGYFIKESLTHLIFVLGDQGEYVKNTATDGLKLQESKRRSGVVIQVCVAVSFMQQLPDSITGSES
jgi:hypothetical protein